MASNCSHYFHTFHSSVSLFFFLFFSQRVKSSHHKKKIILRFIPFETFKYMEKGTAIVTMIYITFPGHIYNWKFGSFDPLYSFCPPLPLPLTATNLLSLSEVDFFFSESTYKWYNTVFAFLYLASSVWMAVIKKI